MTEAINQELYDQVIDYICKNAAIDRNKIDLDLSLLHDIGMDGEDAHDFLYDFGEKFDIPPESFDFYYECYNPEYRHPVEILLLTFLFPFLLLYSIVAKVLGFNKPPNKLRFTVKDLYRSAEAHKWIRPEKTIPPI